MCTCTCSDPATFCLRIVSLHCLNTHDNKIHMTIWLSELQMHVYMCCSALHMHLQTKSSTIFWHFISHSSSLPPPSSLAPLTGCPSLACTSYLPLSLLSSLTAQTQSYGHLVLKCGHTNEVSFSSGSSH